MKPLDILLAIILSVGAIQGLVYAVILFKRARFNTTANRFLAMILFFFSYRLFVEVLRLFEIGNYDIWYHILLEYNWIYGALIYLFVKSYITPNYNFRLKSEWIHFLPVIVEFLWSNFIKTQNFYWDGTRESLSWLGYWGYIVWMHYPTMYIISIGLVLFYAYKAAQLLKPRSDNRFLYFDRIRWIKNLLIILSLYSSLVIAVILADFFFFDYAFNRSYNYPIYVGLAIITYGIGIFGFQKRHVSIIKENLIVSTEEMNALKVISDSIERLMSDEKLFLNPELSLEVLATHLKVKKSLVSKTINLVFEKNFNDYVNSLRILELKRIIQEPKNNKYTLLSLAFEVGFNSKASFNRAVKKLTGKSPIHLKN